jgi:hypothetical protein
MNEDWHFFPLGPPNPYAISRTLVQYRQLRVPIYRGTWFWTFVDHLDVMVVTNWSLYCHDGYFYFCWLTLTYLHQNSNFLISRGLGVMVFNATFNNISVISWRSVLRKPPTCRKSLTNFITDRQNNDQATQETIKRWTMIHKTLRIKLKIWTIQT